MKAGPRRSFLRGPALWLIPKGKCFRTLFFYGFLENTQKDSADDSSDGQGDNIHRPVADNGEYVYSFLLYT